MKKTDGRGHLFQENGKNTCAISPFDHDPVELIDAVTEHPQLDSTGTIDKNQKGECGLVSSSAWEAKSFVAPHLLAGLSCS